MWCKIVREIGRSIHLGIALEHRWSLANAEEESMLSYESFRYCLLGEDALTLTFQCKPGALRKAAVQKETRVHD